MKKTMAMILVLALIVCLLPAGVLAQEQVSYLDPRESQPSQFVSTYALIDEYADYWSEDDSSWYVAAGSVTIDNSVLVDGDVHLILTDDANLTVCEGIVVESGNSLTIYAQSSGSSMGSLTVYGEIYNAGIGSRDSEDSGIITICGGNITAYGGDDGNSGSGGAGIGGGYTYSGDDETDLCGIVGVVTINGGSIVATGGESAPGVGAGFDYSGTDASVQLNSTLTAKVSTDNSAWKTISETGEVWSSVMSYRYFRLDTSAATPETPAVPAPLVPQINVPEHRTPRVH